MWMPERLAVPSPGTRYNLVGNQIAFRGVSPSAIGPVTVSGSATGGHTGRIASDSEAVAPSPAPPPPPAGNAPAPGAPGATSAVFDAMPLS